MFSSFQPEASLKATSPVAFFLAAGHGGWAAQDMPSSGLQGQSFAFYTVVIIFH
jgi:hypothetical protein